jgi:hypothetical protein
VIRRTLKMKKIISLLIVLVIVLTFSAFVNALEAELPSSEDSLVVSLGESNPKARTIIAEDDKDEEFLTINFVNYKYVDEKITKIVIEREGHSSYLDIQEAYLVSGNDVLAKLDYIDSSKLVFLNPEGLFTILGGYETNLELKINISNETISGKTMRFIVTEIETDGLKVKGLPVKGNMMSIVSNSVEPIYSEAGRGIIGDSEEALIFNSWITYHYNPEGNDYEWWDDYLIKKVEGNSFFPIRLLAEKLGAEVLWNKEERSVTIIGTQKEIKFFIGEDIGTTTNSSENYFKIKNRVFIKDNRSYISEEDIWILNLLMEETSLEVREGGIIIINQKI